MKRIFGVILVLLLAISFLAACCPLCDEQAEFTLSSITVSPSVPVVNDVITISAIISNIGEQSGSCDVSLTIGNYTDSKSVSSLASGANTGVSFSYIATSEGSYTVTLSTPNDTKSKSFTVSTGGEENILSMLLNFGSFVVANDISEPCQNCTQNETLVIASQDPLLGAYAPSNMSNMTFSKVTFGNYTSYYYARKIGDAYVELDGIAYAFDKETGSLIENRTQWRNDLPEVLPEVISEENATLIAGGDSAILVYIDPNSSVFASIKTVPGNPCWDVYVRDSSGFVTDSVVIDAVTGEVLGHGVPPPSGGVVIAGPKVLGNCSAVFQDQFDNAIYWFNKMGYSTNTMKYPTTDEVRQYIQSDAAVFFEVAHGDSWFFKNDCNDPYNNTVTDADVQTWLVDHPKMPFAFLLSCNSMHYTEPTPVGPTFSYAFRKGSTNGTVTIGCVGMDDILNAPSWWSEIGWQNTFFNLTSQGRTVGTAFLNANVAVPITGGVMVIVGDQNLKLVPKLSRCSTPAGIEEQTSFNAYEGIYGGKRAGQRLTISNRVVTSLSFPLFKTGSPTGPVTFTIRAVSDDHIINSEVWGDASALPTGVAALVWEEVTFDSPVNINGEVRILAEFAGGNYYNGVRLCLQTTDVKADECLTEYVGSYTDYSTGDGAYKYTYGGCGAPSEVILPGESCTLVGHVTFAGRGVPPNDRWIETFVVRFFNPSTHNELPWSPQNATTNSSGYFTITNLPAGTYDICIKSFTSLSECRYGVVLN